MKVNTKYSFPKKTLFAGTRVRVPMILFSKKILFCVYGAMYSSHGTHMITAFTYNKGHFRQGYRDQKHKDQFEANLELDPSSHFTKTLVPKVK
jgi:hypothetical protein